MTMKALGSLMKGPCRPSHSCPRTQNTEDSDWYLGSWLQGRHKVFDHFGFRDCDSAHHEEDQERVVAGMRPAHLQNKHHLLAIRGVRGLWTQGPANAHVPLLHPSKYFIERKCPGVGAII